MALTNIFTGMEKGPEMIDANFTAVAETDTGWVSDGITMLNGFLKDTGAPVSYRILTFGPIKMLFVTGWVAGPEMSANSKVNICQLPAEATACVGKGAVGGANIRSATGLFQLNTDGTISLVLYYPVNTLGKGAGTWINMMCVSDK